MYFTTFDTWWWPFVFILLAGAIPTAIWRWTGVLLVGSLSEESEWLVLVRCIANALVAAVIAQLVFAPTGALATFPFWLRIAAALIGFVTFLMAQRRMIVGIVVSELVLLAGYFLTVN